MLSVITHSLRVVTIISMHQVRRNRTKTKFLFFETAGLDDFSPKIKRRNMPRTRSSSVVSDVKTSQRDTGHRLRSRKNVNYATPPLDDDSFQETPETESVRLQEKPEMEPVRLQYKEYRELRSSTRALAVSFL